MQRSPTNGSAIRFRPYREGDAPAILALFERCFQNHLSDDFWQWKYGQNPYGRHTILVAVHNDEIIAHYGAYPVRICDGAGDAGIALHIGDVMTDPAARGTGFGRRSVIARLAHAFYAHYCEGRVQFNFGVPSFKHLRLGRLVLDYHTIGPVQEWRYRGAGFTAAPWPRTPGWVGKTHYRVVRDVPAYTEAAELYRRIRSRLGISIAREAHYLYWRYGLRPHNRYRFYQVVAGDRPVLWAVVSAQSQDLAIGDVLLMPNHRTAFDSFLRAVLADFPGMPLILWSPSRPGWWQEILLQAGFHAQPQPFNVRTAFTFFNPSRYHTLRMNRDWFYAMGDFDLF